MLDQKSPKIAVVGSGFGGIAAAIRLQAAGARVTLFEARDKPGGRAYVYEQDGFKFDGGPTVITAPECLEELFTIAGRKMSDRLELLPVKPFYRLVWDDGDTMDYDGDLYEEIAKRDPEDAKGYRGFVEYSKAVFEKGYNELVAVPFLRFMDMVRCAPDLMRLRAERSVYGTVARFVKNEHVRQALSFHSLLVGGNPFDTSAIYTLIHYLERKWGVWYPRGGTGALIRALCDLFVEIGGEIRLSTPVRHIELDRANGNRHLVTTDAAEGEAFDAVVSNADVHHTYAKLYASEPSAKATTRKLERSDWSMSLFVLYFGTDKPYDIAHHSVVFGPRYKELLDEIFEGHELPEDFSLYLHAPAVTDPSMAPEGCGAYYVLSPVPHKGNAKVDWEKVGPAYAEKILASLEKLMPDLRKHVVTKHWIDPDHFEGTLGAFQGAAFSLAPTLTQSAWFRPHNRDPKIPGLYIVGAGTHPGAGVPGVVNSAKATAGVVLADFGMRASAPAEAEAAE